MLLEARESGELVADFNNPVPIDKDLARGSVFSDIGLRRITYSLGSKKKPYSPSYTTGVFLYLATSSDVSWIWANTHACKNW